MKLGWYIHHHGRGHLQRFLTVQAQLGPVTALTSLAPPADLAPEVAWLRLPMDAPVPEPAAATARAGGVLHWAPLGPGGYRDRMSLISAWIAAEQPDAVIVDVSVEVALLARLAGVPVIWVAQRGTRRDLPHQLALGLASSIIAPWTAALEDPELDAESAGAYVHVGALSRFDALPRPPRSQERRVLVLIGFGGHEVGAAEIGAAAAMTPDWQWDVTALTQQPASDNVHLVGGEPDVWALLARAQVVVASASGNAVAEVAAARRPLILLPQPRPFDEQLRQAAVLAGAGLAEVCESWPAAEQWPALLERTSRRDPERWSVLHDGGGARRFAAKVRSAACA